MKAIENVFPVIAIALYKQSRFWRILDSKQTLDFVSGLYDCVEFSQPISCLYQVMQTRKAFSIG